MEEIRRVHQRKLSQKKRDLKRLSEGKGTNAQFNLAKRLDPAIFKAPLNVSRMILPATYEA